MQQVQDDLLQLDAIGADDRQVNREFCLQERATPLQFARRQGDYFSCRIVQVDLVRDPCLLGEHCSRTLDHIRSTIGVTDRAPSRFGGSGSR
jgi:hypothetical protein